MKYWAEQDNRSTLKGIMAYSLTQTKKILKKLLLVVSLCLVVVFGVGQPTSVLAAEVDDVGNTTSWITGYDSSSGKILGFTDGIFNSGGAHYSSGTLVRNLIEKGMTEDTAKAAAAEVHSSLYPLIQSAAQKYDLANSNGANVGTDDRGNIDSEILKWADGADFDGKQANLVNYEEYLKAQSALFTELLKVNEKYPGSLPEELTPEHMLLVIGSNYDILNAIKRGDITASMTGSETVAGQDGVTFIDGAFSSNRYSSRTDQLPADIVKFVDQSQNISEETRTAVKQASYIYCRKGLTDWDVMGCLAIGAYNAVLKLSALILGLVGMLFNMSLNFTLNIGELFLNSSFGLGGAQGAIYVGWSTIRNFINILFIFVLLYVAISTIIQSDKYGAKKMITKIVVAALLINFSLFFTKAVIDLSNILALQFYARILESAKNVNAGQNTDRLDGGLSSAMLNAMGLESMWTANGLKYSPENSDAAQFASALSLDAYQLFTLSMAGGFFIYTFALVLFVGLAHFLTRTIVLLFLMITSPIGFIGGAIPGLGSVADDWKKRLTKNAIFAPVYMAVLFVICQIMFGGARGDIVGGGNFVNLLIGTEKERVGSIGIFFWFFFMMGLLITGQGAAKSFADNFGKGFVNMAEAAFKGKGKYGWRKGAAWTGKKIWTGAKSGGRTVGSLLARGTGIESKKTRDARLASDLKDAKSKADNLRQRGGESKEQFEVRQAQIVNKVKEKQARAHGLDTTVDITAGENNQPGHFNVTFIKDASGTVVGYKLGDLNENGKKALKAQKEAARKKFTKRGRNRAADAAKRAEEAFAAPKPGSSGSVEKKRDEIKSKLEKLDKDNGYKVVRTQLEAEVSTAKARVEAEAASGHGVSDVTYAALKRAQKRYMEHIAEESKHKKELADLEEKLEKVKREEKERDEKEKEKSKKK